LFVFKFGNIFDGKQKNLARFLLFSSPSLNARLNENNAKAAAQSKTSSKAISSANPADEAYSVAYPGAGAEN
jgi:hypothetical protein